ncbi:hypothetical protein BDR26DRAFT_856927 [Obelidium mucronatum]|nr:hypothetical protein BDR26DRAFT_856927 [Obelidium mucronatum]
MRLVGMLARLCGVRLQGFTPDIPGFARCFAQAAANIPEAQALSTALSAMHSLSIVSQVRNMIACAIQLADAKEGFIAKQFAFTPIVSPTLIAVEDSVINNLQVRLCPSEDLRGFIFGFDILCSFQNALAQGFFEVFTTHVADKIKFRIAQPVYNQESDCFLSSFIVDISGVKAMEEYMQGLIDDKKSAIFMNFGSETAAGSGNFTATLGMDDSYVPMSAIAVDFKITEMMFTNRPIYPPRY